VTVGLVMAGPELGESGNGEQNFTIIFKNPMIFPQMPVIIIHMLQHVQGYDQRDFLVAKRKDLFFHQANPAATALPAITNGTG